LFGSPNALIRLDLSEYREAHSIARLIGAPPGYIGYEEGGLLTEKIRRTPYAVVVFDEIEKAHPDLSALLLQILEEGCLTDSSGRRADFSNAYVLITSNIGAPDQSNGSTVGFLSNTEKKNPVKGFLDVIKNKYAWIIIISETLKNFRGIANYMGVFLAAALLGGTDKFILFGLRLS
jgi:ATP-dependent Clp protease ATP-binding subunit ClpC